MTAKKYFQLPKIYLSYTQVALWLADKKKYADLYFDKREDLRITNYGQRYGKIVADALEKGEETGDLLTDAAMLMLPKFDVRDVRFDVDIKTKDGWLKVVAKPDYLNSETKEFIEIKTGVHPWTQAKAEKHLQLPFYATAIWQKYGVKNKMTRLAWIETERVGLETKPTGRIEVFEVPLRPTQYLDTLMQMVRVAKEIELAWASHITKPWITTF